MPLCVQLQTDGTLAATGQALSDCTGYVLLTPQESLWLTVLNTWTAMPTQEQISTWFLGPMSLIVSLYLVAYGVGRVVSMFDSD